VNTDTQTQHDLSMSWDETEIEGILTHGVTDADESWRDLCGRALRAIGGAIVEPVRRTMDQPYTSPSERWALQEAIRGISSDQLPQPTAAFDIGRALLDALRVPVPYLHADVLHAIGHLQPSIIDRLLQKPDTKPMSPERCLQLLEGMHEEGCSLHVRSFETLMRLQKQPVSKSVRKKAMSMVRREFFLVPSESLDIGEASGDIAREPDLRARRRRRKTGGTGA
jgi:hypothetical protein